MSDINTELAVTNDDNNIEDMYLTFGVEAEEYAVNIGYVTEIVGMQKISEVPDVPTFIKGVINLRGKVIPVMDVRLRFGLPWLDYSDRTTIIVLDHDNTSTGLVVDRVNEVLDIAKDNIDPPPRWQSSGDSGVIMGLGKTDESVSIILDAERLLASELINMTLPAEALAEAKQAVIQEI